jgi:hypothetical protein
MKSFCVLIDVLLLGGCLHPRVGTLKPDPDTLYLFKTDTAGLRTFQGGTKITWRFWWDSSPKGKAPSSSSLSSWC